MPPAADHAARHLLVREGRALGSRLRLVAEDAAGLEAAWIAVQDEFAAVDEAMSRFRPDSEVTRLNRSRRASSLSRRLRRALVLTDRARRVTGGRFDPRVLHALDGLGFVGAAVGEIPDARPEHCAPSGHRVVLGAAAGGFEVPSPVDLGGIGKGLALRWATVVASRHLEGAFLIDAGGDLATRSAPPGGWSIGIEDPVGEGPIATCRIQGGQAVATSSIRVGRRPAAGGSVHHLVDPRTGQPGGPGLAAVTVAWPDPAWAEVWTKALFLAGISGIAVEARSRGLAAWWVETSGALSMTPAARAITTWVRDEAPEVGVPVSPP